MAMAVIAFVIAIIAAGGALYAIFKAVNIATAKPLPKTLLPPGQYRMKKVEGTEDVYDMELIEEEEEKK